MNQVFARNYRNSSSCVFGLRSLLGNKRKWVSLPLEEASRDDGDKAPDGVPTRSDTEPNSDSPDPMSPNHTLHNSRAHDSSRSKCPAARFSVWFGCLLSAAPIRPHHPPPRLLFHLGRTKDTFIAQRVNQFLAYQQIHRTQNLFSTYKKWLQSRGITSYLRWSSILPVQ